MSTPEYDELEEDFGEVMALLRDGLPELPSDRPSDGTWEAIAAEVSPTGSLRGVAEAESETIADRGVPAADADAAPEGAEVRSITSARSWGRPMAVMTGIAAALLVGIPLFLATRDGEAGPTQRADLAALAGFDGSGEVELDGRSLNVRLDGSIAPDGTFYELWLLDLNGDEVEGLESLGRIEVAADGSFAVPDGLDLDEFDVVDVSLEPDDGNPGHSGASVLRGGLTDL